MAVFHNKSLSNIVTAMGTPLVVIATIVIGAGIYVLHRSLIIPVHHLIGIGLHRSIELFRGISREDSMNPVIYLRTIGVSCGWGIIAYTYLRGTNVFENREHLNIRHAELGLLVMTGSGLVFGAIYDKCLAQPFGYFWYMLIPAIIFFLAAIPPALTQHALECKQLREKEESIKEELKKAGLLKGCKPKKPHNHF